MVETYFSVLAIGEDAPGIVAAVTGALAERCNVEASQMTIVGGHFAITLIASTQATLDREELEGSLIEAGGKSGFRRVHVSALDSFRPFTGAEHSHTVMAEAGDRPGVLHEIASALAAHEVNITSLSSGCSADGSSLCMMNFDVALPAGMSEAELRHVLFDSVAKDVEFEVDPAGPGD